MVIELEVSSATLAVKQIEIKLKQRSIKDTPSEYLDNTHELCLL